MEYELQRMPGTQQSKGDFLRDLKSAGKLKNKERIEDLENDIKIPEDLLQIWISFWNLSRERDSDGFSLVHPLKIISIKEELSLYNIYCRENVEIIRMLDDIYTKWVYTTYSTKK